MYWFRNQCPQDGDVGVSATNWNSKWRMWSREALASLASPEVVAASAMKGFIAGTGNHTGSFSVVWISSPPQPPSFSTQSSNAQEEETEILPGFPPPIEGEAAFCDADNQCLLSSGALGGGISIQMAHSFKLGRLGVWWIPVRGTRWDDPVEVLKTLRGGLAQRRLSGKPTQTAVSKPQLEWFPVFSTGLAYGNSSGSSLARACRPSNGWAWTGPARPIGHIGLPHGAW